MSRVLLLKLCWEHPSSRRLVELSLRQKLFFSLNNLKIFAQVFFKKTKKVKTSKTKNDDDYDKIRVGEKSIQLLNAKRQIDANA